VREILGGGNVVRDAREARDQPRRFDAPHGVDGATCFFIS
jgi:hypothetical protein